MNQSYSKETVLDAGTKSVRVRDIPRLITIALHDKIIDWSEFMRSDISSYGKDQHRTLMAEHLNFCHLIDAINKGDLIVRSYLTLLPWTKPSDPIVRKEIWKKYKDNEDDYYLDCIVTIDELIKYARYYSVEVRIGLDLNVISGEAIIDAETSCQTACNTFQIRGGN